MPHARLELSALQKTTVAMMSASKEKRLFQMFMYRLVLFPVWKPSLLNSTVVWLPLAVSVKFLLWKIKFGVLVIHDTSINFSRSIILGLKIASFF